MSPFPEAVSEFFLFFFLFFVCFLFFFFWKNNFKILNFRKLLVHKNFQTLGVFGASSTAGCTTNLTINEVEYTAYKNLLEGEHQKSAIWREIAAIEFALEAFVYLLKNSSVLCKTDNYVSAFILVTSGSNKDDLQKTTENIFYFCKENSITLKVMWITQKRIKVSR